MLQAYQYTIIINPEKYNVIYDVFIFYFIKVLVLSVLKKLKIQSKI